VPRGRLAALLGEAREDFRRHETELIYGTVRLIERDRETFLAWAKERYACVVFNLHVEHTPAGRERAAAAFRRLIDLALRLGGSYFLTYHRHASGAQLEAAYPQFREFLRLKRAYDPEERFQSDWYRHQRWLLEGR
jgi:FAD/FMN-containing dehydrogenase